MQICAQGHCSNNNQNGRHSQNSERAPKNAAQTSNTHVEWIMEKVLWWRHDRRCIRNTHTHADGCVADTKGYKVYLALDEIKGLCILSNPRGRHSSTYINAVR